MIKESKWNDRNRHKGEGIKVRDRKLNRRERYSARHLACSAEANEALADLRLDRVISALCVEAGI